MAAKKKYKKRWILLIITLGLLATAWIFKKDIYYYGYKAYRYADRRVNPKRYANKIWYPEKYTLHGIDISRWQDDIDWKKLSTTNQFKDTIKFDFVFIKATEGIWLEDPLFDDFWTAATTLPIYKGAYHYFYPQKNIKQQINNFKSSVTLKPGDLPPVIDIEETGKLSKKEIVKNLKLFADGLKAHYGVRPIIYSNADFINDYLSEDFEEYIFWIAHYYVPKPVVSGKVKWLFWQHADKGVIHGCRELVDVNVFNGSRKDFKNILIK